MFIRQLLNLFINRHLWPLSLGASYIPQCLGERNVALREGVHLESNSAQRSGELAAVVNLIAQENSRPWNRSQPNFLLPSPPQSQELSKGDASKNTGPRCMEVGWGNVMPCSHLTEP